MTSLQSNRWWIDYSLGDLPIIAENLGVITSDVESLREEFRFPD